MVTCSRVETTRPNPLYAGDVSTISPLPRSYKEAFIDPNWRNAMFDEYNVHIKNKTWTSVPRPEGANIVRCMWLFRHKFLDDGTLSQYKARLFANGSTQVEGVDVDETFSPVVKPGTIQTVFSLDISRHWPVHQLDVKNVFLHGDLAETIYMHQPLGFRELEHPNYVCLLQRSLYGLKHVDDTMFLLLYVDDIVLTASSDRLLQQIIASLHHEFYMIDLCALNYFLECTHMVVCNPSRTPVDTESKLGDGGTPIVDPTLYRSLAVSLQYLTFTTPDITYVVQQPTFSHSSAEAEYRGVANAVAETDDHDVIHVDNSSDLALLTSLNDLEIMALHIDGQSIDVDAPPHIIDVDKDDDIIDEEDLIPHDIADSNVEDLINLDIDDGVNVVYSSEEED
nr:ribonuclease H-like domain-containing protein [Tanacetum cinerariifolium]